MTSKYRHERWQPGDDETSPKYHPDTWCDWFWTAVAAVVLCALIGAGIATL